MDIKMVDQIINRGINITRYKGGFEAMRHCFLNVGACNLINLNELLELVIFSVDEKDKCCDAFKEYYEAELKPLYLKYKKECYNYIKQGPAYILKDLTNRRYAKYVGRHFYFNIEEMCINNNFAFYFDEGDSLSYIKVSSIKKVELMDELIKVKTRNSQYLFEIIK